MDFLRGLCRDSPEKARAWAEAFVRDGLISQADADRVLAEPR